MDEVLEPELTYSKQDVDTIISCENQASNRPLSQNSEH